MFHSIVRACDASRATTSDLKNCPVVAMSVSVEFSLQFSQENLTFGEKETDARSKWSNIRWKVASIWRESIEATQTSLWADWVASFFSWESFWTSRVTETTGRLFDGQRVLCRTRWPRLVVTVVSSRREAKNFTSCVTRSIRFAGKSLFGLIFLLFLLVTSGECPDDLSYNVSSHLHRLYVML